MFNVILVMVLLGLILGAILGIANKFFYVAPDEKLENVLTHLPGYNCGGCGFAGCSGFAEALVEGEIDKLSTCKPCSNENKKAIIEYLSSQQLRSGDSYKIKE